MKHTLTLRRNYEFARVYQKGQHVAGRLVVLHYLRRRRPGVRLGVTASRQVSGSVRRNRIKRLLRESYRLNEAHIRPGFDLILVGRASTEKPGLALVEQDMVRLLRRAGLWIDQPAAGPVSPDGDQSTATVRNGAE